MRLLPAIALAILFAVPAVSAQSPATFRLTIKVTDATTATIPNATISISPVSDSASPARKPIMLKTGHDGVVTANLKPETYVVSVSASGFLSSHQQFKMNQSISLIVELRVAPIVDPIEVESRAPSIPTKAPPLHELIPELR